MQGSNKCYMCVPELSFFRFLSSLNFTLRREDLSSGMNVCLKLQEKVQVKLLWENCYTFHSIVGRLNKHSRTASCVFFS